MSCSAAARVCAAECRGACLFTRARSASYIMRSAAGGAYAQAVRRQMLPPPFTPLSYAIAFSASFSCQRVVAMRIIAVDVCRLSMPL